MAKSFSYTVFKMNIIAYVKWTSYLFYDPIIDEQLIDPWNITQSVWI